MKKLSTALIILLALLTIVACNGDTKGPDQNNDGPSNSFEAEKTEQDKQQEKNIVGVWVDSNNNGNYINFKSDGTFTYKIKYKEQLEPIQYNVVKGIVYQITLNQTEEEYESKYEFKENHLLSLELGRNKYTDFTSTNNNNLIGTWLFEYHQDNNTDYLYYITFNEDGSGVFETYLRKDNSTIKKDYETFKYHSDNSSIFITIDKAYGMLATINDNLSSLQVNEDKYIRQSN